MIYYEVTSIRLHNIIKIKNMANISCKYHPNLPAQWSCNSCSINYCKGCIPQKDTGRGVHCPVCNKKLHSIKASNFIKPFWIIAGKFFLYPLHLHPLIFLIALTAINAQFDQTLMGKLMQFVITIVFMKYTYAVLEDTALGHLKPLPITSKVINDELDLPFKQIFLTVFISTVNIFIFKTFGYVLGSITAIISIVLFPANIMVLAIEHRFFSAFNPVLVLNVIKRIGAPYFLLTFLLLLLISASSTVMSTLYNNISYTLFISVSSFINMYFTLVMFHLMGYVLYQYHDELGFDIDEEDEPENESDKNLINPELRTIEILIQEGKTKEASQKLIPLINENPADNNIQIYNLKLQKLLGNMDAYALHSRKYINYLFATQQLSQAASILPTILQNVPTFKPEKAIERFELAKLLIQNGQSKAAVVMINNLHIDFPTFEKIPEAYFLAAKILCEKLSKDSQALKILRYLKTKFPNHSLNKEISDYYNMIAEL